MSAIIVSDLHIGSRYFLHKHFDLFISNIFKDHELILNGDIIDDPNTNLEPELQRILDHIERISYHQKVVWILGKHDNGYIRKRFGNVHFKNHYNIGDRLLIGHGYDFQSLMAKNLFFWFLT